VGHHVDAVEHLVEGGGVQVARHQLEPGIARDRRGVGTLAIGVVEGGEGIESAYRVPSPE
jgi:hypothetical protein